MKNSSETSRVNFMKIYRYIFHEERPGRDICRCIKTPPGATRWLKYKLIGVDWTGTRVISIWKLDKRSIRWMKGIKVIENIRENPREWKTLKRQ